MRLLKPGDLVDLIAPSSPPEEEAQVLQGMEILKSWRLRPRFHPSQISAPWLFHAAADQKRSFDLNQAFFNKRSSAVWALRGGYGLYKLMPSFDKKYSRYLQSKKTGLRAKIRIEANRGKNQETNRGKNQKRGDLLTEALPPIHKLFIGYSDVSPLHLYLNGKRQTSLHAPMICELGSLKPKELETLKEVLFGLRKELVFKGLKYYGKTSIRTLRAKITGGNLSLLSLSLTLPWFPSLHNRFLFIEDVNEKDHKLDGMLYQLLYSGKLKGVRAILFGDFSPLKTSDLKKVFQSFSAKSSIPLIFGLPCGHGDKNLPLPFNVEALLSLQRGNKAQLKLKLS